MALFHSPKVLFALALIFERPKLVLVTQETKGFQKGSSNLNTVLNAYSYFCYLYSEHADQKAALENEVFLFLAHHF